MHFNTSDYHIVCIINIIYEHGRVKYSYIHEFNRLYYVSDFISVYNKYYYEMDMHRTYYIAYH